jgi:hypothetical protein
MLCGQHRAVWQEQHGKAVELVGLELCFLLYTLQYSHQTRAEHQLQFFVSSASPLTLRFLRSLFDFALQTPMLDTSEELVSP